MIFLNTTKQTQLFATLLRELSKTTLPARPRIYEIHSKRTQSSRTAASSAFRRDRSGAAILVTSEVSARGVDYPEVTRVIQVGSPVSTEHSGRLPLPSHHPIPSDVAREGPPLRFPPPCLTPLPIPSLLTWRAKAHSGRLQPPSHHPIPSDVAREGPPLHFPPPCLTPLPIPSLPTLCAKAHPVLPPPSLHPASPPFPSLPFQHGVRRPTPDICCPSCGGCGCWPSPSHCPAPPLPFRRGMRRTFDIFILMLYLHLTDSFVSSTMAKRQLVGLCSAYHLSHSGSKAKLKAHLWAFSSDRKRWGRYVQSPFSPLCFTFVNLTLQALSLVLGNITRDHSHFLTASGAGNQHRSSHCGAKTCCLHQQQMD